MELNEIRNKIDNIDDQIVELFAERMHATADIAEYKRKNSIGILDGGRQREILCRVTEKAGEDLELYTRVFFNTIFALSRSFQSKYMAHTSPLIDNIKSSLENTQKQFPQKAVVACQGVEGAYSQQACDKLFPIADIMYFNRFEGVFRAVSSGMCEYGILPIENSSAGSVTEVYDLMKQYNFHIVRSIKLKVEHCLLSKNSLELKNITEIYSHEQAINQCSEFLKAHPEIKVTVYPNTATAARMVAESDRTDIAAISSRSCAELYGLSILGENIQDSDHNYTRFICISRNLEIYPGADRISVMLSLPHVPGSLYQLIARFASLGLNLIKLESRPIPGKDFEFCFYLDAEASIYSDDTLNLIASLDRDMESFTFLGSYSEAF